MKLNGRPHRERFWTWLGMILFVMSLLVEGVSTTISNPFYEALFQSMGIMSTVIGVPFVFYGFLKRIDVPSQLRRGSPTQNVRWHSAPEAAVGTFIIVELLNLVSVVVRHATIAIHDLWSFLTVPVEPVGWVVVLIVLELVNFIFRK